VFFRFYFFLNQQKKKNKKNLPLLGSPSPPSPSSPPLGAGQVRITEGISEFTQVLQARSLTRRKPANFYGNTAYQAKKIAGKNIVAGWISGERPRLKARLSIGPTVGQGPRRPTL